MNSVLAKLVFLKVNPDMAMLFYQLFVHRKGETANPVPGKVILQVSPDTVTLFSQSVCVHRRGMGPPSASQGLSTGEPRLCHAVFSAHLCE